MEGLESETPFARLVAGCLGEQVFTLVDVGCSAGIDPTWRLFGDRLRAVGFDPNLDEVARLTEVETLKGVSYIPGFVGVPPEDPAILRVRSNGYWSRSPWGRLSTARTLELRKKEIANADNATKTQFNIWTQVKLADPEKPIILPEFFHDHGIGDIDFVKIDVDGPDLLIARSLVPTLHGANVLGVGVEVNFFGSDDPDAHTFHNHDRLMKAAGFELFGLTVRTYSTSALPAPYVHSFPAQTKWGRPLQGDAIYFRDAAAPEQAAWAGAAEPLKLAKLAALFSLARLPDCAAELLLRFHEKLGVVLDVDAALDALASQAVGATETPLPYPAYIAAFEADAPRFYAVPEAHEEVAQENSIGHADAEQAISTLMAALGEAHDRIEHLSHQIEALKELTSWRLLAPLRSLASSVRRVVGGASA